MERVGPSYSIEKMKEASRLSWKALHLIASKIHPGMDEAEATLLAKAEFKALGATAHWHRPLVRFGSGTLKIFNEPSDPRTVLQVDDIFFLDVGPVWDGHEGDVGRSFVIGSDPEKTRVVNASRCIWEETSEEWKKGVTGVSLYAFAEARAKERGVLLVSEIQGHRLSDFPHAALVKGAVLGRQEFVPAPGAWVLEIQVRHPTLPFGAFHEDLLV